jgi:hypothetical protein
MASNDKHSNPGHTPALSRRKRIAFTFLTAVLLALFAEISLQIFYKVSVGRWLWEWWAIPIFEADPIRTYRLKSNLDYLHQTREFAARYRTDAVGMRSVGGKPTPTIQKSSDTFRILSLGPSFAFGWGVNYEDSYIYRIADGLRVPGKRVELINLGTPSQPISYQLKWLRETGHVYQPDLIVQTIYADIVGTLETNDTLPERKPTVRDGYLSSPGEMSFAMRLKKMRGYSALLFFGWHVYHAAVSAEKPAAGDGREFYRTSEGAASGEDEGILQGYRNYTQFVHRAVTNQPPIVFVFVPMAYAVRPSDISRVGRGHENPFEVREKAARLTGLLNSNGVRMIDPTGVLVENDKKTRMYNLYDIHFTAAGNKIVADYSIPMIEETLLRRGYKTAPIP